MRSFEPYLFSPYLPNLNCLLYYYPFIELFDFLLKLPKFYLYFMIKGSTLFIKLEVVLTFIRIYHTSQVHLNPYEGNYRLYDCTCN